MIQNFIITEDFQEIPPLVPDEATLQKIKRTPLTDKRRGSNSNSSSKILSRRQNSEGIREDIPAGNSPQRAWLSRIKEEITEAYILDSIGGAESFVYVIDTGRLNVGHSVSDPSLC